MRQPRAERDDTEAGAAVRLTPAWGVLPVLSFVVHWYFALFFALFALMSWRWEVVAGAGLLGALVDRWRRPALNRLLTAAREGPLESWRYRSDNPRPWLWRGIAFAILYWALIGLLLWVWRVPFPDALMPVLDLLWNAGRNVRDLQARGYIDQARGLAIVSVAAALFILGFCSAAVLYRHHAVKTSRRILEHILTKDRKGKKSMGGCLFFLAIIFGSGWMLFGRFINWEANTRYAFSPQLDYVYTIIYPLLIATWIVLGFYLFSDTLLRLVVFLQLTCSEGDDDDRGSC